MPKAGSLLGLAVALATFGCGETATEPEETASPQDAAARQALLEHTVSWVDSIYTDFAVAAGDLRQATEDLQAARGDETLVAAQDAWRSAAAAWQHAEAGLLGPAGAMSAAVGGQDLRDEIYSWPVVNPCRVDQEIVAQGYAGADFVDAPVNVRGLDVIEYLLFSSDPLANGCEPNSSINADGDWAALSEDEIVARRAEYAARASVLLVSAADTLLSEWSIFSGELLSAGADSELFSRQREAVNAISDSLFYLDKEVKDMKLAEPLGLTNCADSTCPDALESRFAMASIEHVRANVVAFEGLFGSATGTGFDAYLRHFGQDDLADRFGAAIADALGAVDAIDGTLREAIDGDYDGVSAAYDSIKMVTDLLKTEFVSVLDLDLPNRAAGDND
ncbi:MAG: putative lipoprotein [Bradymonadia bacterium]|jgi:predicted lipoprotein